MKKIIAVLTLLLAFSINATAQAKSATTGSQKAKKETAELTAYLGLTETQSADMLRLFEKKHKTIEGTPDMSDERRAELARVIEAKIRASLDERQTEKLEKNPELLKNLVN